MEFKAILLTVTGVVGGFISSIFGGWSTALTTLLMFMIIDYITGLLVAGLFHKSNKTTNGALESNAGFKGLIKKGMALLVVLIGFRLDIMIGTNYIKDAVVIAFVVNELISIVENMGLMGIPMPEVITKAIDVLQKNDKTED